MDGARTFAPQLAPVAVLMTLHRADPLDQFDRALASVERQRFTGEIRTYLCVDGAVPESHETWLAANAARFHRVIRNRDSIGLARALNRLFDMLDDEELVFRMDGDDISLPDRFAKQARMMRRQPELAVIGCQAEDIDDDDRVIGPRPFPVSAAATRRALARLSPVLHPTFCIRRAVLRDPGLRYPDAYLCEDLAFLVTLAERGHAIANHPEVLFQWRTGTDFFARRRDWRRGWTELRWYLRALRATGRPWSPAALYPVARFALRLLPLRLIRVLYRSGLRDRVLGGVTG